jgi:hypothetical protein
MSKTSTVSPLRQRTQVQPAQAARPHLQLQALHRPAKRRSRDRRKCCAIYPVTRSGRHLEPPPHGSRRCRHRIPLEGLPHTRLGLLENNAALSARVHPALPAARVAQGLPPLPPPRAPCQASRRPRLLIRSTRIPRCPLHACRQPCAHASSSACASIAPDEPAVF